MSHKLLFILLTVCIIAIALMLALLPSGNRNWIYLPTGLSAVVLLLLYLSMVKTISATMRGIELVKAQDFNNRLAKVGEHNADLIVNFFNTLIDKLRNERLKNLEQDYFLQLLIEASPMGVMILDFDGNISLVNKSMLRLMDIADEDEKVALGRRIDNLTSDMASKMTEVALGENEILRRGDRRLYRCYHLSFIQTGFSRHFYLLESLTEEVMKAEREAYEKVIRIISHEVNNTMGGVKSVLGMIRDTIDDEEEREVIESCDERCESMCSFIRAYADVVKMPEPVKSIVDLGPELEALLPFLREMIREDIELVLNKEDQKLIVDVDIAQVEQVIVNIVKNAVESLEGKGHVWITVGSKDKKVWVEIANDGEPISEQVSSKLFSPFFTTKRNGQGIGLTLISDILRRHGAGFSLRTGSDGITRFHIEFAEGKC